MGGKTIHARWSIDIIDPTVVDARIYEQMLRHQ
jgi:hypothetical protein